MPTPQVSHVPPVSASALAAHAVGASSTVMSILDAFLIPSAPSLPTTAETMSSLQVSSPPSPPFVTETKSTPQEDRMVCCITSSSEMFRVLCTYFAKGDGHYTLVSQGESVLLRHARGVENVKFHRIAHLVHTIHKYPLNIICIPESYDHDLNVINMTKAIGVFPPTAFWFHCDPVLATSEAGTINVALSAIAPEAGVYWADLFASVFGRHTNPFSSFMNPDPSRARLQFDSLQQMYKATGLAARPWKGVTMNPALSFYQYRRDLPSQLPRWTKRLELPETTSPVVCEMAHSFFQCATLPMASYGLVLGLPTDPDHTRFHTETFVKANEKKVIESLLLLALLMEHVFDTRKSFQ